MPQYSTSLTSILILRPLLTALFVSAALSLGCNGDRSDPDTASEKTATGKIGKLGQAKARATPATSPPPPPSEESQPEIPDRSFADLAKESEEKPFESAPVVPPTFQPPLPKIDGERVAAAGIRKIEGAHLALYTDLPSAPSIDELPAIFDAAIPHWAKYFDINAARANKWQMAAYLIQDKARFQTAGLLPPDLPPFLHGYQRDAELWLYEQPSDYYRRHLLLHEGTHGFMKHFLGGAGPPWYMEGTAELLATHQWDDGQLKLRWFPRDKQLTPHWGRIKIIKDDIQAGRGKSLEEVFRYDATAHLNVEPYAWCWAAAAFFDSHPEYQDRFRELQKFAPDTALTFSQRLYDSLRAEWLHVTRQWQVFVVNIEYGFDIAREAIEVKEAKPLPAEGATVTIAADRGWQSSGFVLETGATYRIEAAGRYQIADEPKVWQCEPNGVTIRYHNGRPLGMLVGAIVDEAAAPTGITMLVKPDPIGLRLETPVESGGTLFLRINDSPAELADNAGTCEVRIARVD
jgi:hypothetical protein